MDRLFRRKVVDQLEPFLSDKGAIVLHGARQVGKTSILRYLQNQLTAAGEAVVYFDLEDSRTLFILDDGVDAFLAYLLGEGWNLGEIEVAGKRLYVMIDEIQYMRDPSPFLKLLVDHHPVLKLVVSGSSSFEIRSKFRQTLVGRTVNFEIYPLSFKEFLQFKGVAFVENILPVPKKIDDLKALYLEFALYGGYPQIVLTPEISKKEMFLQQIIDTYIRKDIRDLAEIRDIAGFNRLLEVLSGQSGGLLNVNELANTCRLSRLTVERYLFFLEQTYIIRLLRPFSRNLRSELIKTPKVFFCDTGLMQMLWLKRLQRELLGPVFENSVFSELLKGYGMDRVAFWRTQQKQEIDFIIKDWLEARDGAPNRLPLPVEVKASFPAGIPSSVKNFQAEYASNAMPGQPPYRLVGLIGEPAQAGMIYPWQL